MGATLFQHLRPESTSLQDRSRWRVVPRPMLRQSRPPARLGCLRPGFLPVQTLAQAATVTQTLKGVPCPAGQPGRTGEYFPTLNSGLQQTLQQGQGEGEKRQMEGLKQDLNRIQARPVLRELRLGPRQNLGWGQLNRFSLDQTSFRT